MFVNGRIQNKKPASIDSCLFIMKARKNYRCQVIRTHKLGLSNIINRKGEKGERGQIYRCKKGKQSRQGTQIRMGQKDNEKMLINVLKNGNQGVKYPLKKFVRLFSCLNFQTHNQILYTLMKLQCLIALLLVFGVGFGQDWGGFNADEGFSLPHIYADDITLIPATGASTINFTQTYSTTINSNSFSSSEMLYIATAFLDFSMDAAAVASKYIEVSSAMLSTDRTQFQLMLKALDSTTIGATETPFTRIRMSFIVVGSQFEGMTVDGSSSTFVYAKNADMEAVDSSTQARQFSFATSSSPSPFNYLPTASLGHRCGFIGGNIEVQSCSFARFYVYFTGFSFISNSANSNDLNIASTLLLQVATISDNYQDYFDTAIIGVRDQIFKETAADTTIGLPIRFTDASPATTSIINRIQLSFVFVGIRDFDQNAYPAQTLFLLDTYIHFGDVSNRGASPSNLITRNLNIYQAIDEELAHAFCGLSAYINGGTAATQPSFTSVYTFNVNQVTNTFTSNNNIDEIAHSCALFKTRNGCTSPFSMVSLAMTSDRIANVNTFGNDANGKMNLDISIGPTTATIPSALNPTVKFRFNPVAGNLNAKITLKYNRPSSAVFRGIIATSGTGGFIDLDSIKLTVFGKVIIDQTITVATAGEMNQDFTVYSSDMTQNTLMFEFTADRTATPGTDGFLEFGLISYDNVLDGISCTTMCTDKTNFQTGIMDMGNVFDSVPVCIFCDSSKNLVYLERTAVCGCDIGFHDNDADGDCQKCTDSLCNSCATNSATCDICVSNSNGSPCTCIGGFFPSTTQTGLCQPCNIACLSCTSATSCTACRDSNSTREAANLGCVCKTGFYDTGELICLMCDMQCLTCAGTATTCVTCNPTKNFILSGSTCVCQSGFYLLRTDTDVTCQRCDSSCKECSGSSLICTECDTANAFRAKDVNNNCVCIDGYIELQGTCIDVTCSDIDANCQSCAFDPITGNRECLACTDSRVFDNGKCKCKVGFYDKPDGTCGKCGSGCSVCGLVENDLKCFECAFNFQRQNADGTCTCPASTIVTEGAGILFCKACSSQCRDCQNTFDFCTSCNPPATLKTETGTCVCPEGTFTSPSGGCAQCMMSCLLCKNGLSCDQCAPLFVFNGTVCTLNCPRGTYKDGNQCKNCSMGCNDCVNAFTCIACQTGFFIYLGSCTTSCPLGTFSLSENICFACVSPCKTCSGPSANECDSCVDGFVYFNRECRTDCVEGTYFADGSCLACSNRCKKCSGISTQCTGCFDGQFLFKGSCFSECPAAIVNGECTDKCPDGNYLDGNVCKACSNECQTCEGSATNCLRCSSGFKSYQGSCLQSCPQNTLDQGAFCSDCDPTCNGCSGSTFLCTQCAVGFVKSGLRCIERCLDGQYLDPRTQSCEFCGSGCKICTSTTNCIECFNPLHSSINGECRETCPPGSRLVGTECVCTFGVKHLGACVSSCPEGFYAVNGQCQSCLQPCKACFGSATTCLSCREGFSLDSTTRQCVRDNECPFGQFPSESGCKNRCSGSLFFHKGVCVFSCPAGFQDNGFSGCIQQTNPTICPVGQYQKGTDCVKTCNTMFYANDETMTCQRCIPGCIICINGNSCFQCDVGKVLIGGACMDSIGCSSSQVQYNGMCMARCPVGTYRSGMTCIRGCRAGTFFYNNLCYQSCPTRKRTLDACVQDCTNVPNCTQF